RFSIKVKALIFQHFTDKIHQSISGRFCACQAASVLESFAGQHASFKGSAHFFVLTEHIPISLALTPTSPAGTSVSGPICLYSSVMKLWQNRMTSISDLSFGSKSDPPFPPPI